MSRRRWLSTAALVTVLALAPMVAMAQGVTTGKISGTVVDENGEPLPGATVVATSDALQGERAATTDADGRFFIPALPSGTYSVRCGMNGYQAVRLTDIVVQIGATTPVRAVLKSGEAVETIMVTAEYPLIDTKSADTSVHLDAKTLDTIPTAARSFRELTQFVPSITGVVLDTEDGSQGDGYPSIRGEGQYGDNYLIDGLTVRDPAIKTTATPLPFDAIKEVQIITDGFSPEYGQALGGTVNVITKTGSNQFGGEVAYLHRGDGTTADFKPVFLATPTSWDQTSPYLNVGGPILKDKLWYFGSYNRGETENVYSPTEITGFGTLPAGVIDTETDTYFGKLTWSINPRHTLSGNYTFRDFTTTGLGAASSTPEARSNQEGEDDRLRINYQAVFSANSVLEVKIGTLNREIQTVPVGSLGAAQYRLTSEGVNINNAWRLSDDERERTDYAAIYTHFFNPGGWLGSHELRAGVEVHEPEQINGDDFTGTAEDVFSIGVNPDNLNDFGLADTFNQGALFKFQTTAAGDIVPITLDEYRSSGALSNRNEEMGFFIQDRWEVGKWNILLGFRADEQDSFNDAGTIFFAYDYENSFSPRASVTWDSTGDGKNVFKAGWGRFYDVSSTRFGEFANTREAFSFRTYTWIGDMDFDGIDFRDERGTGSIYDIHEMANWSFDHEQSSESNPLDYSDMKRPAHADRFLLEYNRQVGNNYALKARFVDSAARGLIDDIHYFYNDWRTVNTDYKRRDYNSFELEFNGNPTPNITFNASYVNSASKGTNPGQFETAGFVGTSGSGNNIGVFMDRPPSNPEGWCDYYAGPECVPGSWIDDPFRDYNNDDTVDFNDRDLYIQTFFAGLGGVDGTDGWYGHLPYSVENQVKLFGRFNIPKWGNTYITGFFQWSNGYHYNRRGLQHLYGDYLTFSDNLWFGGYDGACTSFADCETLFTQTATTQDFTQEAGLGRGELENASFWTLDMSIGKMWNFGKGMGLELRGEFFNLLNNQDPLSRHDRATNNFGEPLARQFPRSARAFVRLTF